MLLSTPVLSLKCYVCSSSSTDEECNKNTQECLAPADTCMTVTDTLGSTKSVSKECASQETCNRPSLSVSPNGDEHISCCNSHDWCNLSGTKSVHAPTPAPAHLLLSTAGVLLLLPH